MLHHFTITFLLYLSFLISSSFSNPISSSYSSFQTKFWSQNVQNKMPLSISTKLSPLTKHDSDFYAKTISGNNFKADAKFCAIASLACTSDIGQINTVKEAYATTRTYNNKKQSINTLQNMDPFSFFRISILKGGNTIHLSNLKEHLPYRAFIPPQIASKISLTTKGIAQIFPESAKDAIDTTLSYCNAESIKGELKTCPKSLEEMISFSKTALRTKKLLSLSSESTKGSGQVLTIEKVTKFDVEKTVACHEMFLPFATYFCHSLPSSRIYSVEFVEPKTKAPVNTVVAMCHMDTSPWPANHVAFQILKFGPGEGEACHWLNEIDLAWIAAGGKNI
ncbi:hypothetical protein CASFOL_022106 [Castilleja foliolosa]|uniref:BURP domain-containing protein n=1 Tax=Castilleja foliolosa TaxID=1961234 RepID=A0ABD3CZD5_9LAMI